MSKSWGWELYQIAAKDDVNQRFSFFDDLLEVILSLEIQNNAQKPYVKDSLY